MINVIIFIGFLYLYNILEAITILSIFSSWNIMDNLFAWYIIMYSIFITLFIINFIHCKDLFNENKINDLKKYSEILKKYSKPFWIINIILMIIILTITSFATRGIGIIFIPFPIIINIFICFSTSKYKKYYFKLLNKKEQTVVHKIVLHE
jgi:uncharacterized protein YutD